MGSKALIGGKFNQLKRIQKGGYGEVYECIQINTNNKLAIKISRCYSKKSMKQAKNQYKIMKQLDHPNVIKIFDFFQQENQSIGEITCLVMELGQTSLNKLFQKQLAHQTIVYYITQIANGLNYLHSNKIAHLDLKPQNIIVFNKGETVKISDFGTSRYLSEQMELTQTHTLGSRSYMSPQRQKMHKDYCVDIWSIGIILYQLCKKQRIYRMFGINNENFKKKISQNPLSGEYEKYNQLILLCLNEDSKTRIKIEDVKMYLNSKKKQMDKLPPPIKQRINSRRQLEQTNQFKKSQNNDEAIFEYSKIIDKDPKSIQALKNRANLYQIIKSFQLAAKDYTQIIDLNYEDPKIYNQRGKCRGELKEYKQAQEDYRKAIRLNPNFVEAYQNLGMLCEFLDRFDEALKYFKICLELDKHPKLSYYQSEARVSNEINKKKL